MPLLEIWKATRESVLKMNLEAIVRIAGDGRPVRCWREGQAF